MSRQIEKHALSFLDQVANASGRTVDTLYATLVHKLGLTQPFFKAGWGDLQVVDFQQDAQMLYNWPPDNFDVSISWRKVEEGTKYGTAYKLLEGTFRTPCQGAVYDAMPERSRTTYFQLLAPRAAGEGQSCVIHLAATGDHGFERRIRLGAPLLQKGIATLALESPFYGKRRPEWQQGSRLVKVSDLLVLGRSTIEESLCLLEWAAKQGFSRLGMSGFSMGGVHASMVSALYPKPVACTPILAPRSASVAFCRGALKDATAWTPLTSQEDEKHQDVLKTVRKAAEAAGVAAAARHVDVAAEPNRQPPEGGHVRESYDSSPTGPAQDAEGLYLAAREVSSAEQEVASETGDRAESQAQGAQDSNAETATSSYGSAAAYLGFRLPGWVRGGDQALFGGLRQVDRQLSHLRGTDGGVEAAEARHRLEQVLETYTDVTRFPCPKAPHAAVLVGALQDAYVTQDSIREMAAHWPGSEVRWVPGGHVSAFLLQQPAFRTAINDSLDRLKPPTQG